MPDSSTLASWRSSACCLLLGSLSLWSWVGAESLAADDDGAGTEGGVAALESRSPRTRAAAVRACAREGTREAWGHVIAALADPEAEVGDAAQRALLELRDDQAARALLDEGGLGSDEARVRRRAAEVVADVPAELDTDRLARRLRALEPPLAAALLDGLERRALAGRPCEGRLHDAVLQLWSQKRSDDLRARALLTLAACGCAGERDGKERLARRIEDAGRDRAFEVRGAAALAARVLTAEARLGLRTRLSRDEARPVRLHAIDALASAAGRREARVLAELVGVEEERTRTAAHGALQRLSGLRHRADPRPWRDWAAALPEDWGPGAWLSPGGRAAGGREAQRGRTAAKAFQGLPADATRVAFLIDFSGSMWTETSDGSLPKEHVARALDQALHALPKDAWFNVVPFANEARPWAPAVVRATPRRVREALEAFDRCALRGRGNLLEAVEFALADEGVETIVMLTDGVPTGGFHAHLELIVAAARSRNRFRRVRFEAVLVDAPRRSLATFEDWTRQDGGRTITWSMP